MHPIAKALIIAGFVLILLGIAWQVGARVGLGRLPGDIVVERERFRLYIPLATSILLSLLLSLGLSLLLVVLRWFRSGQ